MALAQLSALKGIVREVHHLGSANLCGDVKTYNFFADGLVGLIYCETDADIFISGEQTKKLFLFGQTIKPVQVSYRQSFSIIVFCFEPYALRYLFGIDASQLTDTCIDFDMIDNKLGISLEDNTDTPSRISTITDYLIRTESRLKRSVDDRIAFSTGKMIRQAGNVSLQELREELYLTERTFERQFLQYVGVTPKVFSKICRFNHAIKKLENKQFENLTQLAYSSGYADQSHFIRHFKDFTSMTPTEYLALIDTKALA